MDKSDCFSIGRAMLVGHASYEISLIGLSVHLSVHLSVTKFLKIGSLVFSEIAHDGG